MKLEIIKSKSNSYKIISHSSVKHPALILMASLLSSSNKSANIKIGIFNVFGGEFSLKKSVYSYISGKVEKMNKRDYNKWINGTRQIKIQKEEWKAEELDLTEILGGQK